MFFSNSAKTSMALSMFSPIQLRQGCWDTLVSSDYYDIPHTLLVEGIHGTEGRSLAFDPYFLGDSVSLK